MQAIGIIGRGIVAAFKARLRQRMARLATMTAGLAIACFGLGMVSVGGIIALAQHIGPTAAFCGVGGALVILGLLLAQTARKGVLFQQPAPPIQQITQPLPKDEMPAAAAIVFVLGFIAVRALLRAIDGRQD